MINPRTLNKIRAPGFARDLRRERALHVPRIKQSYLAARLDMDETTVSKWENGHQFPERDTRILIAEILPGMRQWAEI